MVHETAGGPVWDRPLRERRQVTSSNGTAPRGLEVRRDCSCRSASLFEEHGAAAGGARSGILDFSRAGWILPAFLMVAPVKIKRGSGGGGIGHCQMPVSRPRRFQGELPQRGKRWWPGPFGFFLIAEKETRPAGRNPHIPVSVSRNICSPSSGPSGATFPQGKARAGGRKGRPCE